MILIKALLNKFCLLVTNLLDYVKQKFSRNGIFAMHSYWISVIVNGICERFLAWTMWKRAEITVSEMNGIRNSYNNYCSIGSHNKTNCWLIYSTFLYSRALNLSGFKRVNLKMLQSANYNKYVRFITWRINKDSIAIASWMDLIIQIKFSTNKTVVAHSSLSKHG